MYKYTIKCYVILMIFSKKVHQIDTHSISSDEIDQSFLCPLCFDSFSIMLHKRFSRFIRLPLSY